MNKLVGIFLVGAVTLGTTAVAPAAPKVYIPLGTANEILVVDAADDKVIGRIGDVINPHGLAATPDGKYLIAGSNREVSPDQAALPPKPVGMSEEEHNLHHSMPAAATSQSGVGMSHVAIIETQDRRVVRRVDVKGAVHHNLVTPDGRYAISTHTTGGGISAIDLSNYKVAKVVPTGPAPNYAAVTKDGKRIYVSNAGNNTISEIDTDHWIVTRNILAGVAPEHMVLSPDEHTIYVNNIGDGTVSVISLDKGKVVKTYNVGNDPHGVDLSDDGKMLFVAVKEDNKLIGIDLVSGRTRSLDLSPAPYHVAAIRGTGKLYVSSRKLPKVWVVDQRALKVLREIPIRGVGHQMAVAAR
ncbi:MAG: beta-propeller fold lactonase family protein [Acidiferrobacterales bacterium]